MNTRHPTTRYLDVASAPSFGKSAFLPQAAAVFVAGAALSSDVPFALFIQTLAFVALNKVYENTSIILVSFRRFSVISSSLIHIVAFAVTQCSTLSGSFRFSL
jgi:hypothetical protein